MELFKLYLKDKANFFCLIKLLFIKVRCLINVNVSLEANLEKQRWWTTLVGSNLGIEIFFEKEGTSEKDVLK